MSQDGGTSAVAQAERTESTLSSPPPPGEFKVPPPKRVETGALNDGPSPAQAAAACASSSDKIGDRVGERGVSNLPAWMTQGAEAGASVTAAAAAASVTAAAAAACAPPPLAFSDIKIPAPKTAAEAAVSFPLLSLAAASGAKRDREDAVDGSASATKRPRESTAAAMFQEVAMLLQDAEVEATGEQQHLEVLISRAVQSGEGLRSVSIAFWRTHPFEPRLPQCFAFDV